MFSLAQTSTFLSILSSAFAFLCTLLKGRRSAAQKRRLLRPHFVLVFRAAVDGPSRGRRAFGASGRTCERNPLLCELLADVLLWYRLTSFSPEAKTQSSWLGRALPCQMRKATWPSTVTSAPRYWRSVTMMKILRWAIFHPIMYEEHSLALITRRLG